MKSTAERCQVRGAARGYESESKSLNCQPQSWMGKHGEALEKAPEGSDKFVWMQLPGCSGRGEWEQRDPSRVRSLLLGDALAPL